MVDATGAVEYGCHLAMACIDARKHLVLMNAEIIAAPNVLATDRAIAMVVDGPLIESVTTNYRIVVSNNGPLAEPGPIVVTDLLPSSLIVGTPGGTNGTAISVAALPWSATSASANTSGAAASGGVAERIGWGGSVAIWEG